MKSFVLLGWVVGGWMSVAAAAGTTQPDGPREAVAAFLRGVATADSAAIERRLAATNADEDLLRPSVAAVCAAVGRFDQAMTAQFGTSAAGQWGVGPTAPAKVVKVTDAGDKATVEINAGTTSAVVPLVRQNDVWKLAVDGVPVVLRLRGVRYSPPADEPLRRLVQMAEVIKAAAADVGRGDYATAADAAKSAAAAWDAAQRGADSN